MNTENLYCYNCRWNKTKYDLWLTTGWRVISGLLVTVSLRLLFLSMGDNVTQVLVVQVSSNIQGKVCEHLVNLKEGKMDESKNSNLESVDQ